jgi:hypothetical protein
MRDNPTPLTNDDQEFLAQKASAIRALGRNVIRDVVQIGQHLSEVKERLGHGHWLTWIEHEFSTWSERSARRFVEIYELSKSANLADLSLGDLQIDLSGLYLLAAPSTPEAVRSEMLARAATEPVRHADVQRTIRTVVPVYVKDTPITIKSYYYPVPKKTSNQKLSEAFIFVERLLDDDPKTFRKHAAKCVKYTEKCEAKPPIGKATKRH